MPDISFADGSVVQGVPLNPTPEQMAMLTAHANEINQRMVTQGIDGIGQTPPMRPDAELPLARNLSKGRPYQGSPEQKNEQSANVWKGMSPGQKVLEGAKVVGSAVKKAVDMPKTMVLGAGGLLAQGVGRAADFTGMTDGTWGPEVDKFLQMSGQYRADQDKDITPQTGAGQRYSDAGAAGLGVLNFGPAATAKNVLFGGAAGLGGEVVGATSNPQGFSGKPDMDALQHEKLLTTLTLGATLPTLTTGIRSGFGMGLNKRRVAEDFTDAGLTKGTVDSALPKMQTAQNHGVDLLVSQALGDNNSMIQAAETAAKRTGSKTGRAYINQPQQILETFGDTQPTMPGNKPGLARMDPFNRGTEQTPHTLEVQTNAGLDAHGRMLKQEAGEAYRQGYSSVPDVAVPEATVAKLHNELENLKGSHRGNERSRGLLEDFQKKLTTPEWRGWDKSGAGNQLPTLPNPDFASLQASVSKTTTPQQLQQLAQKSGIPAEIPNPKFSPEPPKWVTDQTTLSNGWREITDPLEGTVLANSKTLQDANAKVLGEAGGAFRRILLPDAEALASGKAAADATHEANAWAKNNALATGKDSSLLGMAQNPKRAPLAGQPTGEYSEAAKFVEDGLASDNAARLSQGRGANPLGNPELSQDVNKTLLTQALEKARDVQQTNPGGVSKSLSDSLGMGANPQARLTEEVARVAGNQGGTNPQVLADTLQALKEKLELARMTSERSGAGPLITKQTIKESSSAPWERGLSNWSPVTMLRQPLRWLTHGNEDKIAHWLDEANTGKVGMDNFTKYLGLPPDKLSSAVLADTLSAVHATREQRRSDEEKGQLKMKAK